MADVKTTASVLGDSQIALMDQAFQVEAGDRIVADQFASYRRSIGAKSIDFVKYSKMDYAVTELTDGSDVDAVAMADSKVTFTPKEYGNVVTKTSLASLQSGGKADLGASQVVARNMAESLNRLACLSLQGSANNKDGSSANITEALLDAVFFELNNKNAERWDGDAYVCMCHPAVAQDIAGFSAWKDVQKYADAMPILRNEVGVYKGFRFISSTGMPFTDADPDVHESAFFGRNAFGKAESQSAEMRITGPFDKLGRMLNIGWYWVGDYGIVDQDSLWSVQSLSSYVAS